MNRSGSSDLDSKEFLALAEGRGLSVWICHASETPKGRVVSLRYALIDAVGDALAEGSIAVPADSASRVHRTRVAIPIRVVRRDPTWSSLLEVGERVSLRWRIELRDAQDRRLARKTLAIEYRARS